LVAVVAPTGRRIRVQSIQVTPDATTIEHAIYELYTAAAGTLSGGTPLTARSAEAYETAYDGSCASLPTVSAKLPTQPLHREGVPFVDGFRWEEDPGQLWLGSGEALVVRQAFTTAVASSATIAFDEVD
jgi:hypothetical protein